MSFKPIQFNYSPPLTVPTPVPIANGQANSTTSSPVIQPVKATFAINSLNDLIATNNYVQKLIVDKYNKMGISIDSAQDPETAKALAACYNGVVPPIITTAMYNNLLDCQFALQSINQATGISSSIEADPIMLANVTQINNAVANSLLIDGGSNQMAIQSLALLKGDNIIFANLSKALAVYNPGTDLGTTVEENINTLINNQQNLLATLYSLQTDVNVIIQDINNVINAYFLQPLADITRITAAINLLMNMNFKAEAKKIFDGLGTITLSRLISEVAPLYLASDQIVQRVLAPLRTMVGTMGQIINTTNKTVKTLEATTNLAKTTAVNISKNGINGFANCNPCSQQVLKGQAGQQLPNVPGFNGLSIGLQFLGQHITSSMSMINKVFGEMESSFIALQKRRNKDFADVLQLMCATQSAEQLINIGNASILQRQTANVTQSTILNSLGLPLTSVPPPMTTTVANVLIKGGANISGVTIV